MAMHASIPTGMVKVLIALLLPAMLAGCAKPPPAPIISLPAPPTIVQLEIKVAANANPDSRERASPLAARLYELKSLNAFRNADFFALFEHDRETLGNDLVIREDIVLQPGEQRQVRRELQPDTRFLAVIAGYRNLESARWKSSAPITLHRTTTLGLQAGKQEISMTSD